MKRALVIGNGKRETSDGIRNDYDLVVHCNHLYSGHRCDVLAKTLRLTKSQAAIIPKFAEIWLCTYEPDARAGVRRALKGLPKGCMATGAGPISSDWQSRIDARPTTGLIAVSECLARGYFVELLGFDFYTNGQPCSHVHSPTAEATLVHRLHDEGLVFVHRLP